MYIYYAIEIKYEYEYRITEQENKPNPERSFVNCKGIQTLKGAELALNQLSWIFFSYHMSRFNKTPTNCSINGKILTDIPDDRLLEITKDIFERYQAKCKQYEEKYGWIHKLIDPTLNFFGIRTYKQKKIEIEQLYINNIETYNLVKG